jgi:hypothetical protein
MNAIINSCQSHLTAQQHAKLAQHYHNRHFAIACTQVIGKKPARQTLLDYAAIYQKYLYHKRAAASLRAIEAQRRTETGLLALGTVLPEPEDFGWCPHCNTERGRGNCLECREERYQRHQDAPAVKPIVEAHLEAGHTYYRHGDKPDATFEVLSIAGSKEYQREPGCMNYRMAQVRLANGETVEKRMYANQRFIEVL